MVKAYILDLDGTLLDSLNAWDNVGNRYLESISVQACHDLDEILTDLTLEEAACYIQKHFHLKQTIQEITAGICHQIADQYENQIELKPGVLEFLNQCQRKGIEMVIFTASDFQLVEKALLRLDVIHYFKYIFTCENFGFTKKQKESYIKIAERIGYKKNECIVVEDALYAIKTAKAGGFTVKAIYDQNNQKDWLDICKIADENYISFMEMEV